MKTCYVPSTVLTIQTTSQSILTKTKGVYLAPATPNEPNVQMTYLMRLKALTEYVYVGAKPGKIAFCGSPVLEEEFITKKSKVVSRV